MTREDAIEFGNMWLQMNEDCKDSSTYAFFHMAIEALQQQEEYVTKMDEVRRAYDNVSKAVPCEDCISREASLMCVTGKVPDDETFEDAMQMVVRRLKKLPSVTPAPKLGRWIYKYMQGQFCSLCDKQCVWKFEFCPNCGAKMI